jgi:hypothetical protein
MTLTAAVFRAWSLVVLFCLVVGRRRLGSVRGRLRSSPDVGTEAQRESGKNLYLKNCVAVPRRKRGRRRLRHRRICTPARDFTTSKFKVRTTPNGALPTHQDLVNIIRRGMPYTSMPAWPNLSDQDLSNLAYFITSFSPEFTNPERVPKPDTFPSAPASTNESIELGKKLYAETGCLKCHGTSVGATDLRLQR